MEQLIADVAERIFADHVDRALLDRAEAGEFPGALWAVIHDAGLHLLGDPEADFDAGDLFGLLKLAGRHAVPLPLAEILVAASIPALAAPGRPPKTGVTTIAVRGVAPWARAADRVLTLDGELCEDFAVAMGANLAGEPRDRVTLGPTEPVAVPGDLFERLALSRVALMAGALDRILAMTIDHATERQQFGRPISKFQAVQHGLAVLAGEVAAAGRACDGAVQALGAPGFADQVAAAKARLGEAGGVVAEIAHQIHGAMGFTHEHGLHHYTRRIWAWRDEYGRESQWQERLGRRIAAGGADQLWDFITRAG